MNRELWAADTQRNQRCPCEGAEVWTAGGMEEVQSILGVGSYLSSGANGHGGK